MKNYEVINMTGSDLVVDGNILKPAHLDLEKLFEKALTYGRPRVSCGKDKKFSAHIEMWLNVENAEFEITSGFGHPTARDALEVAVKSAEKAVQFIGGCK